MGTDYHAQAVMGFQVCQADFIHVRKGPEMVCARGHLQPEGEPVYCSKDGTPFHLKEHLEPTEALKACEGGWPDFSDAEDLLDWWVQFAYQEGIHYIEQVSGETLWVYGTEIADSGSSRGGAKVGMTPWDDLRDIHQELVEKRAKLGFEYRPILMFTWLNSC